MPVQVQGVWLWHWSGKGQCLEAGAEGMGVDGVESRDNLGRNGDWTHGPVCSGHYNLTS